ncbi:hypothetical protein N8368_04305 [Bacteroidia bacterium]|nr:hypothetical protein [Bacteroidia bacterium]MDB9882702.1 hypothetical protein [Bacteroidia bacterium]MDC1395707.1 hypothetical protein [Bacteroidia bacterium]
MSTQNKSKNILYILIGVLLAGSIAYRLISDQNIEKTSILFIGLPALLSTLILRFASTPKTAYGVVFLVITLFFLVSAILLGEGFACILYAAPFFYGVGSLVAFIIESFRNRNKNNLNILGLIPAILLLAQPSDFFINAIYRRSLDQLLWITRLHWRTSIMR